MPDEIRRFFIYLMASVPTIDGIRTQVQFDVERERLELNDWVKAAKKEKNKEIVQQAARARNISLEAMYERYAEEMKAEAWDEFWDDHPQYDRAEYKTENDIDKPSRTQQVNSEIIRLRDKYGIRKPPTDDTEIREEKRQISAEESRRRLFLEPEALKKAAQNVRSQNND